MRGHLYLMRKDVHRVSNDSTNFVTYVFPFPSLTATIISQIFQNYSINLAQKLVVTLIL